MSGITQGGKTIPYDINNGFRFMCPDGMSQGVCEFKNGVLVRYEVTLIP